MTHAERVQHDTFHLTRPSLVIRAGAVALLAAGATAACSGGVTAPYGDADMPVVQILLIVGRSRHLMWVERAVRPDSLITDSLRPVPPGLVDLWLVLPLRGSVGPDSVRFEPAPDSSGAFEIIGVPVEPEQEYRLSGTVNGQPVSGRTTTPGALRIEVPEQDTIRVRSDCGLDCRLAYRWHSVGAAAYEYAYQAGPSESRAIRGVVSDTSGVLALTSGSGVSAFQVLAYNAEAVDFYVRSSVSGNLQGAFGAFAAASTTARVIVWE